MPVFCLSKVQNKRLMRESLLTAIKAEVLSTEGTTPGDFGEGGGGEIPSLWLE
eukprot:CAMPEP_0206628380 /NCGR_PEP_ID=MMETSP0325_2-20121206/66484_1 /ASSEMBLY_ACC=CAM_ASM_000347 /TAXON_ID=2866 /ORGANISM="Crypthecodinium cohnii, Strain Seligo" /LENGTH=52 /DNA_ID=CAMNT_0054153119 /DNA_START=295 /DNA_END=453 /DNA_ORIENTATION=+